MNTTSISPLQTTHYFLFLAYILSITGCGTGPQPERCTKLLTRNGNLTGGLTIERFGERSTRGTLGIMVHDNATGRPMALTACHVLSASQINDCPANGAGWKTGLDPFYPRGANNCIGTPIRGSVYQPTNSNDWGLIDINCPGWTYDSNIIDIGTISSVGIIDGVNRVKYFEHQISNPGEVRYGTTNTIDPLSEYFNFGSGTGEGISLDGDSGSVVVDASTGKAVGLLHSGSGGIAKYKNGSGYLTANAQQLPYILAKADVQFYDPKNNPVGFFRYAERAQAGSSGAHRYTADWGELADGSTSTTWNFERREGAIFKAQPTKPQSQPEVLFKKLYSYASLENTDYLYTTSLEHGMGDDQYCYLGVEGYVPEVEVPGTVKLYRYYRSDLKQHFYTLDPQEAAAAGFLSSDVSENGYWVYAKDGPPDPPTLYQGPADAQIIIDPNCSSANFTMNGRSGRTTISGIGEMTIGPNCKDPVCSLTVSKLSLFGADFSLEGKNVSNIFIRNDGYALGEWRLDNSYILPLLSTTIQANFSIDGTPLSFINTNTTSSIHGTLTHEYSQFTLEGEFTNNMGSVRIGLCGHVVAHPPVAIVTPKGPFECDSPAGASPVFSSASSYDIDNDIVRRQWHVDGVDAEQNGISFSSNLALGAHSVSVSIFDSRGASSTATEKVIVQDTTAPQIVIDEIPNCLWPPNHKMVLLSLGNEIKARAIDACEKNPEIKIIGVTSNQLPMGDGSGSTPYDVKYGNSSLCIRAERDGTLMTPREYTITLEATDHSLNKTTQQVIISVPHSQSAKCSTSVVTVADDDPRCLK